MKIINTSIIRRLYEACVPLNMKYTENAPVQHQFSNTECGIFVLYFIVRMLKGADFNEEFKNEKNLISDEHMTELREKYFNSSKHKSVYRGVKLNDK